MYAYIDFISITWLGDSAVAIHNANPVAIKLLASVYMCYIRLLLFVCFFHYDRFCIYIFQVPC